MTAYTLAQAEALITFYAQADIPCYTWGPPGVGKSDLHRQVTKKLNWGFIDFRVSQHDPVDLSGMPVADLKNGVTRWLSPSVLPQVARDGEKGILLLDEANTAVQLMEAALYSLVLDRFVGDYKLPKGWVPMAAGNRMSDKAAARKLGTAIKNRFAHIEVAPDIESWCAWANKAQLNPMVVGLLRFRPELLHKMPVGDENTFPTPRAWEKVARIVDAPDDIRHQLIAGLVGEGPAGEAEAFIRIWKGLPSIATILSDPKGVNVPPLEPAVYYAVATALAQRVDAKTFANAITYMRRLPKEFEMSMVVDATGRNKKLKETKAYAQWCLDNKDVAMAA